MELRFAVVEDRLPDAQRLEGLLRLAFGNGYILVCDHFESGDAFLQAFPSRAYQAVFLDICMEGTNGIDTARTLRRTDPDLPLVFVTSSPEYVWDAFPVHPFDYLLKPYREEKLFQLADELRRVLFRAEPELEVRIARQQVHLPLRKIQYAMAQNHYVRIVSDDGFGRNDYIETTRSLIVVTAPGPGSGKMATCLSQLYHEHKRGVCAGYAKFETFPIWNLPLRHPVNLAYEAATVDLDDVNMIDPFHLEAYGVTTVNYNRDVEIFPVLNAMFQRIYGSSPYKSPTDMGVNMVGYCISDDDVCCAAAKQEILRRYYTAQVDVARGIADACQLRKLELVMQQADVTPDLCPAVAAAKQKAEETGAPAGAMVLPDGRVVTGKTSSLLGASAALLLNALKAMAGIRSDMNLISNQVIEPISALKIQSLGHHNPRLHSDEVLIALAISALTNPLADMARAQLGTLRSCDAHFSVIISEEDVKLYKRLGIHVSCEPKYESKRLYHK